MLSLDREQLGHAVRSAYGEGMDADGYLRRFIDLEYRIPKPEKKDFVQNLSQIYGIRDYKLFKEGSSGSPALFLKEFTAIAEHYSLRTIEKAFLRGSVMLRALPFVQNVSCEPQMFLLILFFLRELNSKNV